MFNGIIEQTGSIQKIDRRTEGSLELEVRTPFSDLKLGESVALNGACLTVTENQNGVAKFFVSHESLDKTTFSSMAENQIVNLERALRYSDRISGHLVQGHVDTVGVLKKISKKNDSYDLFLEIPKEFMKWIAPKGSICVDGVSLTVNEIFDQNFIRLTIIPHTWNVTTFSKLEETQNVHLEFDVIAKTLERLCQPYQKQ